MNKYIEAVNLNNNFFQVWENLKSVIHKTATVTLRKREKKTLPTRGIKYGIQI
jgi:hypothetical protein